MKEKTIVLGHGFMASHLDYSKYPKYRYFGKAELKECIELNKTECVINAIGYCGNPNIDQCELDKKRTFIANTKIPLEIAEVCQDTKTYLINISSGCIFQNNSPHINNGNDTGWQETDIANPPSYYSKTKAATDIILGDLDNVASLRIRMPISSKYSPRNLISKLIGYSRIIDIPNSVTFLYDFVRCIDWFVENRFSGIYHTTNTEPLTAAQIMKEYQKHRPQHQFDIIDEAQLNNITKAKRSNCLLDNSKLLATGFQMSNSEELLTKCISEYIANMENNVK